MLDNYSTEGAICPHCGHMNEASDSDGLLYDEGLGDWECDECEEVFEVSAYVQWSWTTRKKDTAP